MAVQCELEAWHPDGTRRWSTHLTVTLPIGGDPHRELPPLAALRPFHGPLGWFLRYRAPRPGSVRALLATEQPSWGGRWLDAAPPASRAPWSDPRWRAGARDWIGEHVGEHDLTHHRGWGRSTVWRVRCARGELWFKEAYALPPGEGVALELAAAGGIEVPELVAADRTRVLMRPYAGQDLRTRSPEDWADALSILLDATRELRLEPWLRAGVEDLRTGWKARLVNLFRTYGLDTRWADRYADRFEGLPWAVVPQDLGPCNVRWLGRRRVQAFDWSDVVISTPGILLDRFLNEVHETSAPDAFRDAVVSAFGDPEGWAATRRIALLHEVYRFHRELAYLDEDAPLAVKLRINNRRQLARQVSASR